MIQRKLALSPF